MNSTFLKIKWRLAIISLIIIINVGAVVLAAVPNVKFEAESGTSLTNSSTFIDSTASNGQALQFSNPSPGNCAVSTPHIPDGPDGIGGCWPGPSNTGVPDGTVLTNHTSSCVISTPNTTLDKKRFNCDLQINTTNVTITNSEINGRIYTQDCSDSFTVRDSTIHVSDINFRGLSYCGYIAIRVDVSGGNSMAWCASCTIQDSYLHNPLEDPTGKAHNSTVRMDANALIKHNTLWCHVKEYLEPGGGGHTSGCSANQTGYSHDGSPPHNSRLEANLYMPTSGGFCAYGGSTHGDLDAVHDIIFINNIFKRGPYQGQGYPTCGIWGAITSFDGRRPGNQWINNRWDDGTVINCTNTSCL